MKVKTTIKSIKESTPAYYLVETGYCNMQYLLNFEHAVAYTCGVYGWNFDVYEKYPYTICTGYRGMPGRQLQYVREYESAAERVVLCYKMPFEKRKALVDDLLIELLHINTPNSILENDALKKANRTVKYYKKKEK